jgi:[NiFe] hydrogenase assembly HybE family chaperone
MQAPSDLGNHPRVQALIAAFQCVDGAMRDLPVYNATVAIEAIDFNAFGEEALLGVLLTPWFMNLIVLPVELVTLNMAEIGKTVPVDLPSGKRTFVVGGDAAVGLYRAHSLHSPVLNFTLPGQARAEAKRLLAWLMTKAATEPIATNNSGNSGTSDVDRRALLFGRRNA